MPKELQRKINLEQFKLISYAISTYEDLNVLNAHIVESICRSFNVKGCSIFLFDEHEKQLFRVSSYGISEDYLQKGPIYAADALEEFKTGQPVLFTDFQHDPRVQYPEAAAKEGIVAMLSVPIRCKSHVLGLLKIYHSEKWILHSEDLESIRILADHLGLVIENNGLRNFLEEVKMAMRSLPKRLSQGL
ncbi:MAG: GAF domain-containing protein [Proteobacteria bacterium]|nr:GAF domain-containing protein [Pseudomonadota bacterium]